MRIYTKFGDKGNTSLLGGTAILKSDPRLEAYGSVDELNAVLGIVISFSENGVLTESITRMQSDLFIIGAELSSKGAKVRQISLKRVSDMEAEIDKIEADLPPIHHFIFPGGSKTASLLHLARTVCRRAERAIVALSQKEKVNPDIIVYMNRVGDLLFVLGRYENYKKKVPDVTWKGR
jgi:cob(I)alamin adenosyltransferase